MQYSNFIATLVALRATSTLAMPAAVSNAAPVAVPDSPPPVGGYGYDGKPLDASFCEKAGPKVADCKKEVEACDKKFDDKDKEAACSKAVRAKYPVYVPPPPPVYGYDGKPLDAGFCAKAGPSKEVECRKAIEACDKKFDDKGKETQCSKDIRAKYPAVKEKPKQDKPKQDKPAPAGKTTPPPPPTYGYDGKPLDNSFCQKATGKEEECRKAVKECDKKYDANHRELECLKGVQDKYKPVPAPTTPPTYGYDGKPLDNSFCQKATGKEEECRKAVKECDKRYDANHRELECLKGVQDKYKPTTPPTYGYDGKPLDASFCAKTANKDKEAACRKAVADCDKKFDNNGRENGCLKDVQETFKPLDASFCSLAGSKEKEDACRYTVKECDKKFDNNGREKECVKVAEEKYTGLPANALFCAKAGSKDKLDECKKAVDVCDKKFDNNDREKDCLKIVEDKYTTKPLDSSFCDKAGTKDVQDACKKAVKACDNKFQSDNREKDCVKVLQDKYKPKTDAYGLPVGN